MTTKQIVDTTSNSNVYNKARKMHLDKCGKIHCSRCPYHKYENYTSDSFRKSWKEYRNTQYKMKAQGGAHGMS